MRSSSIFVRGSEVTPRGERLSNTEKCSQSSALFSWGDSGYGAMICDDVVRKMINDGALRLGIVLEANASYSIRPFDVQCQAGVIRKVVLASVNPALSDRMERAVKVLKQSNYAIRLVFYKTKGIK